MSIPRDKVPNKIKKDEFYVVNLDDSVGKGTHWVVISNFNDNLLYFDSFGVIPPEEILKLGEVIYNVYRVQDMDSKLCGLFCLDFLESVRNFNSYNKWLLKYSPSDYKLNDKIVSDRLNLR